MLGHADKGDRIVAVCEANETTVFIYGRGVYAGDFPRPGSGNWSESQRATAEALLRKNDEDPVPLRWLAKYWAAKVAAGEKTQEEADEIVTKAAERREADKARPMEDRVAGLLTTLDLNPRLDLDNGRTVWGFQCWWGHETGFEKWVGAREIVEVAAPGES